MIDTTSPFAHLFSDTPATKASRGQPPITGANDGASSASATPYRDFATTIAELTGARTITPPPTDGPRPSLLDVLREVTATLNPTSPVAETPTEAQPAPVTPVAETPEQADPTPTPPVAELPEPPESALRTTIADLAQTATPPRPGALPGISPFMNGAEAIFAALTDQD